MIEYNKKNARLWSIMGINPAIWSVGFADTISNDKSVIVLTADLKRYSGLQRTFENYPDRCLNVGIAEQNMVGIAAGMSMCGFKTYMTTYAPFMTLRCADQVRHLMGNLNLDMKAIGSAAGLSAGLSGPSLLAINDIALMRSIPNMTVLSPADCMEAIKMMEAMRTINGPVYMRFCGATRIPVVYDDDYEFIVGKGKVLRQGSDIALIATGTDLVSAALKAAEILADDQLSAQVVNIHTIKPLDNELIDSIAKKYRLIVTIEEHNIIGGLGSAVAERLTASGFKGKQLFLGVEDKNYIAGNRAFMLDQAGLTAEKIVQNIKFVL
ncbi:MAG: transketolase [Bacteroidales bacterium]|nr:transketolase [Bacteroidales bacterium]MBD5229992.1 transketolase [Bacteroidales bacterium]MBD5235063.1 transketolase [Barnesiella sp.]MBD5247874.1 transketolase [Barnesiella sp.]MBD5257526.1 transketolase [Barnesiella sp.]